MIRRRIDLLSVIRCLQRGTLTEGPAQEIRTGNWRCTVEARIDGNWLRVVVEIADDCLPIITAIVVE